MTDNFFKNGGAWPPDALAVISAAGLDSDYADIKQPARGDATCDAVEDAIRCPAECK